MNSVVATSLMVIALISTSAVASAAVAGHLNLAVALPFAGGAILAMLLGRPIAGHLAGPRLQQGFALVSGAVAIGLLINALYPTENWIFGQIDMQQMAPLRLKESRT